MKLKQMSMTVNEFKQEVVIRMAAAKMIHQQCLVEDECKRICESADKLLKAFEIGGGEFYHG